MSMKIIGFKATKDGLRKIVTVEVGLNDQLVAISPNSHYRLGPPVEDVVASHVVLEAREVSWCSSSQEWVA